MMLAQNVFRKLNSTFLSIKEKKIITELCNEIESYIKSNVGKDEIKVEKIERKKTNKAKLEQPEETSDLTQLIDNLQDKVKED